MGIIVRFERLKQSSFHCRHVRRRLVHLSRDAYAGTTGIISIGGLGPFDCVVRGFFVARILLLVKGVSVCRLSASL